MEALEPLLPREEGDYGGALVGGTSSASASTDLAVGPGMAPAASGRAMGQAGGSAAAGAAAAGGGGGRVAWSLVRSKHDGRSALHVAVQGRAAAAAAAEEAGLPPPPIPPHTLPVARRLEVVRWLLQRSAVPRWPNATERSPSQQQQHPPGPAGTLGRAGPHTWHGGPASRALRSPLASMRNTNQWDTRVFSFVYA